MWRIWRAPNNASKGQMGFNSAFKGLNNTNILRNIYTRHCACEKKRRKLQKKYT